MLRHRGDPDANTGQSMKLVVGWLGFRQQHSISSLYSSSSLGFSDQKDMRAKPGHVQTGYRFSSNREQRTEK